MNAPPPSEKPGTRPVIRAARMLALAHYVERLVEDGILIGTVGGMPVGCHL